MCDACVHSPQSWSRDKRKSLRTLSPASTMAVTQQRLGGGQSVRETLENRVIRREIFVREVIEAGSEAGRLSVRQCGVLSVVVKADCSREQEAEQITVSCR